MTREEAIVHGKEQLDVFGGEHADFIKLAIKALEQESRWIPCSEKLPNDRREVLVTAYWHETYQVMMASYFGDGLWWYVPFNNSGEHTQILKPKAWMPLPAPYNAEMKNENVCNGCYYNDGKVHAECVVCAKAEKMP